MRQLQRLQRVIQPLDGKRGAVLSGGTLWALLSLRTGRAFGAGIAFGTGRACFALRTLGACFALFPLRTGGAGVSLGALRTFGTGCACGSRFAFFSLRTLFSGRARIPLGALRAGQLCKLFRGKILIPEWLSPGSLGAGLALWAFRPGRPLRAGASFRPDAGILVSDIPVFVLPDIRGVAARVYLGIPAANPPVSVFPNIGGFSVKLPRVGVVPHALGSLFRPVRRREDLAVDVRRRRLGLLAWGAALPDGPEARPDGRQHDLAALCPVDPGPQLPPRGLQHLPGDGAGIGAVQHDRDLLFPGREDRRPVEPLPVRAELKLHLVHIDRPARHRLPRFDVQAHLVRR